MIWMETHLYLLPASMLNCVARWTGLKKSDQARLVGKTVAQRAKDKGIDMVVFDRGGFRYTGRVKALADGAREGGLDF